MTKLCCFTVEQFPGDIVQETPKSLKAKNIEAKLSFAGGKYSSL